MTKQEFIQGIFQRIEEQNLDRMVGNLDPELSTEELVSQGQYLTDSLENND